MTNLRTDLHLVIRRAAEGDTLEAGPFTYSDAVARYEELRAAAVNPGRDLYAVRSMDDPKFAHLAPRVYDDRMKAAKALGRRVSQSQKSRNQHRELWLTIGGGQPMGGWWRTANQAKSLGYIAVLPDGRAYLTTLAGTLTA